MSRERGCFSLPKFMAEQIYKPGEAVPKAGLYLVLHHEHRKNHEVTLFMGEQFPLCRHCGEKVRFQLLLTATHIGEDADFKPLKSRRHSTGRH